MLKIVYPICCGIDVHKTFLVACIASTNDKGVTTYKSSRFSTYTNDLRKLSEWLYSNSCTQVCMESTGKYWIPVFNILEATCKITLAHPKYVKAIRGKKTDKKDAKWIADLFKHDPQYERRSKAMLILDDEKIFLSLCIIHAGYSPLSQYLIENSYLTDDFSLTKKGHDFKKKFIESHKDLLYQAMKKNRSNVSATMEKIGIKDYRTFLLIEDELWDEGRYIRESPSLD